MKATVSVNGNTYEIELTEEQEKQLEKELCKSNRWRASSCGKYFYLSDGGEVKSDSDIDRDIDRFRYQTANYFELPTNIKTKKYEDILLQEYKDYIGEDIVTKENWGDIITPKYYAVFNIVANDIIIMRDFSYNISQGTIYSKSFSKIEKFINRVGKDKFKKYILKFED